MFGFGNFRTLAAAAVLVVSAGVAQAATCSINDVTFTLNTSSFATCVAGNDLGANGIVATNKVLFGLDGWQLGDSSDAGAAQTGLVNFDLMPIVDDTLGDWSILSYNGFDPLMIVLKSGSQYGAFLISQAVSGLSGTWSITQESCTTNKKTGVVTCKTTGKELSHTSLYHQPPALIPVPAAGLMLLGALGGLAALRRRRRAV